MSALESRKNVWHGRLHAERHARETCVGELAEVVGIHRIGIRLGRDLGPGHQPPGIRHSREHCCEIGDGQHRGRAPAEEHGGCGPVRQFGPTQDVPRHGHLGDRLAGIVRTLRAAQLVGGVGVEVTVPAAHPAERHVQVDTEVAFGGTDHHGSRQRAVGRRSIRERKRTRHQAPGSGESTPESDSKYRRV